MEIKDKERNLPCTVEQERGTWLRPWWYGDHGVCGRHSKATTRDGAEREAKAIAAVSRLLLQVMKALGCVPVDCAGQAKE